MTNTSPASEKVIYLEGQPIQTILLTLSQLLKSGCLVAEFVNLVNREVQIVGKENLFFLSFEESLYFLYTSQEIVY